MRGLGPAALAVALIGSAAAVAFSVRGRAPAAGRALWVCLGGSVGGAGRPGGGVAGTTTGTQVTAPLSGGDEVTVRGFTLRLDDVVPAEAPDGARAARAALSLRRSDDALGTLTRSPWWGRDGSLILVARCRRTLSVVATSTNP